MSWSGHLYQLEDVQMARKARIPRVRSLNSRWPEFQMVRSPDGQNSEGQKSKGQKSKGQKSEVQMARRTKARSLKVKSLSSDSQWDTYLNDYGREHLVSFYQCYIQILVLGAQGIRAMGLKRAQGNAHCAKFESHTNRVTFETNAIRMTSSIQATDC